MVNKMQFLNRALSVILDDRPYFNIHIEKFPNGYGFSRDGNIILCQRTISNLHELK